MSAVVAYMLGAPAHVHQVLYQVELVLLLRRQPHLDWRALCAPFGGLRGLLHQARDIMELLPELRSLLGQGRLALGLGGLRLLPACSPSAQGINLAADPRPSPRDGLGMLPCADGVFRALRDQRPPAHERTSCAGVHGNAWQVVRGLTDLKWLHAGLQIRKRLVRKPLLQIFEANGVHCDLRVGILGKCGLIAAFPVAACLAAVPIRALGGEIV
mmetsp:Transcript_61338/g.176525  ORF Transcript_61338/g.176525 Transcript_61338/m.176525 type:complete len:214 (-) Transcript_61338:232-873(-)